MRGLVPIHHTDSSHMHRCTFPQPATKEAVCSLFHLPVLALAHPPPHTQTLVLAWSLGSTLLPFLLCHHLWQVGTTSGPFVRPPVASWLYLLIPFSVCLHLLTGFNLPALALTPQKSPFLIIFYSDWLRLRWHSLNIQLWQRRSSPSPGMHEGDIQ